ncbi:hypothetical protein PG997_001869 [Apiospora hydei]|uniref:Uncharacterized protein n=1 Tax=Apiospora hydei TaxID=1337664 RepID=A0ABR1X7X3_9PEZI
MHRVVRHFGPRLRGLWFMERLVWREVERALLRIPWRNRDKHGGGGGRDGGEASALEGIDPWDILVGEDREVSRDLVASGQVRMSDLPI